MKRFQRLWGTPGIEFAANISFYTHCNAPLLEDEIVSDRPIHVFMALLMITCRSSPLAAMSID
jgi:hypothetical protein